MVIPREAMTTSGGSDRYPYSYLPYSLDQWAHHQRELDIIAAVMTLRAVDAGWSVERRPEHPQVRMRRRKGPTIWYLSATLQTDESETSAGTYQLSIGATRSIPWVYAKEIWYQPFDVLRPSELADRARIGDLLDRALVRLREQMNK